MYFVFLELIVRVWVNCVEYFEILVLYYLSNCVILFWDFIGVILVDFELLFRREVIYIMLLIDSCWW